MGKILNKLLSYLKDNPTSKFSGLCAIVYSTLGFNKIKGVRGNQIIKANTYMKNVKILIEGYGNMIDLSGGGNLLKNCFIYVHGNINIIKLGRRNLFIDCELHIEDDQNKITFNDHNRILGKTHIACCEGTDIIIGSECLFSSDVIFRTSDSHSIMDLNGNRINPASSISICDHVWFGNKTIILKGLCIGSDCIIGTGSVVTKSVPANSIVVGNPASVVKSGVQWDISRK